MSHEGQAPSPGGYPPQGQPPQHPQAPAAHPAPGQPGQYAPQQPGQYAPAPGQPAPQQGYAPQPGQYAPQPGQHAPQQGQYAPQAPAAPRPNPFKGVPVSDLVRDGVAALLLLVSLALPVSIKGGIGDGLGWLLLIVTLVSVVSLSLPYLARGGLVPATWTVHTTRTARLVANAPYALLVVVWVVLDIFKIGGETYFGTSVPLYLGTAFSLGLAGAVLAAQPRQSEMGPENLDLAAPRLWRTVTLGIAGLAAATLLLSLVFAFVHFGDLGDGTLKASALITWALGAAFTLWVAYGVLVERSPSWRFFLIGLATAIVVIFVFGAGDGSSLLHLSSVHGVSGGLFSLTLGDGLGAIFLPALAAAAASPAFTRTLPRQDPATEWTGVAVHALDYIVLVAVSTVVPSVLWLISDYPISTGSLITTLILGLVVAAAAVYARLELVKSAANGRLFVFAAAGLAFVLGTIILIVLPDAAGAKPVNAGHLLLAYGLPIIAVFALTVPKESRAYFAQNRPAPRAAGAAAFQWTEQPGQAQGGYPAQAQGGYPAQQGGYPAQGGYGAPQGGYAAPQAGYPAQAPAGSDQQGQYGAPAQAAPYGAPTEASVAPAEHAPAQQPVADQSQPAPTQVVPVQAAPEGSEPVAQAPVEQAPAQQAPVQDGAAHHGQPAEQDQPVEQAAPAAEPAPAAAQAAAAAHGYTAAQALDPSTTGLVLSQIVQEAPELRAQVAANPTTYPALLEWLGQLGDPEVDAALRNRQA